jgi:hypothetical protein
MTAGIGAGDGMVHAEVAEEEGEAQRSSACGEAAFAIERRVFRRFDAISVSLRLGGTSLRLYFFLCASA